MFFLSVFRSFVCSLVTCLQLILDEKKHSDRSGGAAADPSAAGRSKRVRAAVVAEDKENFDGDD